MLEHLIETFGYNNPFSINEIKYNDFSEIWIYKSIAKLCDEGKVVRFEKGIYYIPKTNQYGVMPFDPMNIIEKKYINDGDKVIGYFTGRYLLYKLGIITTKPATIDIYTNNEAHRKRVTTVGGKRVLLHIARTPIDKFNAGVLSFLELMNGIDIEDLDEYKKKLLADYINEHHITKRKITEYIKYFPNKTCRNLIESEVIYSVKL